LQIDYSLHRSIAGSEQGIAAREDYGVYAGAGEQRERGLQPFTAGRGPMVFAQIQQPVSDTHASISCDSILVPS
jgi:hypothetical protein